MRDGPMKTAYPIAPQDPPSPEDARAKPNGGGDGHRPSLIKLSGSRDAC